MNPKNKLRILLLNTLGPKNVDRFRYLKFSYYFGKILKSKTKKEFIKKFSDFYEPEMELIPKIMPRNPEFIIDIGANYGPHSIFLSKLYPNSKILAFEPSSRTFNIFNKLVKNFDLKNIYPIKKGLGIKEETREIYMPMQYTILAYVLDKNAKGKDNGSTEKIDITTLDKFVKRNKISKIDFIQCDVEGFELNVFKGAKDTLKKHKPVVFVEIEERHTKKYNIKPNDVMKLFKKLGYNCYSVKNNIPMKTNKIDREIPLYLLVHKSRKFNLD